MQVRTPQGPLPPIGSDLPTEPLTRRKLRRLADGVNDLTERIEAVGLTDSTRADASRLRLIVCRYARWAGLRDESAPPWAGYARDLLTKMLRPLNWCYASDGGKHTAAEIVAALRRLSACMAKVAGNGGQAETAEGWTPEGAAGDDRTGTRQKRPKKRTRRSKRPAEVLKEARERHAAKILAQRPGITSRELGQELDCDASTVTRLQAWAKRGVNDHPKPPTGFRVKRDRDEGGPDIDAID